jgi:signal transduction histidine kinase
MTHDLKSKSAPGSATLKVGLPWSYYLILHLIVLAALGLTLYAYQKQDGAGHGPADAILVVMVAAQVLCYLIFTILPRTIRWPAWPWCGDGRTGPATYAPMWWVYLATSVALVLAESRIDRSFQWFLFPYICQVFVRPLRISIPMVLVIVAAFLLNLIGWHEAARWDAQDWFERAFGAFAWLMLAFFIARAVVTSAQRGRLILELQAAKRELELARDRELELAALRERERLARDLHDNLGHALVTLTVQLEAAARLQATDPARVASLLGELQTLTRSSMADLRRSLANLRTPGLGECPLVESLQTLCREAGQRLGANIDCQVAEDAAAVPPAVAEVLWRVAQEGLTNIEKHAHAQRVEVNLTRQPREVVLRVGDDGTGLPPGAGNKPGHYGLRGLRERVEGLGGVFSVAAAPVSGTCIEARIPVIAG